MTYYAVCVSSNGHRIGIVANSKPDSMANLVGYVWCNSLPEAVKRAGMMERDEPNAWGVIRGN